MTDSRLFKATRKTIRAEVTLIIVIIITFSWSAYALYKLVIGNPEHNNSILSLVSPTTTTTTGSDAQLQPASISQPGRATKLSEHIVDTTDPKIQLAHYRNEILKELLERQRRLLGDDFADHHHHGGSNQGLISLMPTTLPNHRNHLSESQNRMLQQQQHHQDVDFDELKQWHGGHKLPTSLDYLFENSRKLQQPSGDNFVDKMPLASINAHSITRENNNQLPANVVHLVNAPSLMQLGNGQRSGLDTNKQSDGIAAAADVDHDHDQVVQNVRQVNDVANDIQNVILEQDRLDDDRGDEESSISPETTTSSTTTDAQPNSDDRTNDENSASPTTESPLTTTGETTTIQPENEKGEGDETQDEANNKSNESKSSKPNTDGSTQEDAAEQTSDKEEVQKEDNGNDDPSDRLDDDSIQRVKKTVNSIDEEVDRMTQPSSGMASQQDKPLFDYKNVVQFDDSLPPPTAAQTKRSPVTRARNGQQQQHTSGLKRRNDIVVEHHKHRDALKESGMNDTDLQTADDGNKIPLASNPIDSVTNLKQADKLRRSHEILNKTVHPKSVFKQNSLHTKKPVHERRTFVGRNRNEREQVTTRRNKRSISNEQAKQDESELQLNRQRGIPKNRRKKKKKNSSNTKRSDDEGDGGEEDDEEEEEEVAGNNQANGENDKPSSNEPIKSSSGKTKSRNKLEDSYKYITTNDPSLQDLLAHKQLLDALQQSQLPAPTKHLDDNTNKKHKSSFNTNHTKFNQESSSQTHGSANNIPGLKTTQSNDDHQPADTHYTVDHGLLLYPSAGEDSHHKSMSKKSHKGSKKKSKKKMVVAIKKGGHKKKKHKKEEKKYLKEKKFKGAKKGKKMKKGKGGKGGKKGKKYYKDKGFKKKGFKNIYVKNEFGQKKSYFDEFRDKDFKKKWKNYDDKYHYAQMKKWQAKDVKGAKKMKDHGEKYNKYDKGKWKKKYHKEQSSNMAKKKKKYDEF